MAKLRVHELAKELNIKSQDVLNVLKGTEYEVKTSSNSIDDAAQAFVRSKLSGTKEPATKAEPAVAAKPQPAKQENKPTEAPKSTEGAKPAEAAKTPDAEQRRPKKKASISAVFNPQNSKTNPGSRRQAYHTDARSNARPADPARRPVQPKPAASAVPAAAKPAEKPVPQPAQQPAPQVEKTAEKPAAKPERQIGKVLGRVSFDTPTEKKVYTNRPQGDRGRNGGNGRPVNRPQGDRPYNNGNRFQGNRPQGDRPQGDRGYSNANRSFGNDRRNGGNAAGGRNGGRFDQEMNRFNRDAVQAGPDDLRKESRDNRSYDNNRKNNRNQDHDKLGKKQERFVNLEKNGGKKKHTQQAPKAKDEDTIKSITLPERMTIKELADKMKVQASEIIKKLFLKGQMVTVNQEVDYETAEEIALEFNCIAEPEEKVDVIAELLKEDEEDESTLVSRPPVVCVMGHVDHGKTSLLDAIRDTHVTDREAGGITQHIGAYVVSINGQRITFLDTPGHEAFTAMRMRGAKSTDIAILVVAADDGVMPQTVEAINHAKAAGIEIIVAINKIDKPNANIDRVKQELSEYELIPEDWGGSTIFVPVSAHTHEGIDSLLEMILLTAEVLELKANPDRKARGVIIEAQLDKGRGAVATALVQKGTLEVGQPIACGSAYGKVRAMIDDKGRRVKTAGPSTPVEILGLSSVPDAGETFVVCESEKDARSFAETYISEGKAKLLEETRSRMSLDDLFSQIQSGDVKELNIIVKADVQGSVEAVKQSLVKLSNEEVVVKIIHGGVGAINESDVILASASNAIIIGFNVRPDPTAKATAENENVDVRLYKVIYNAIEDVEAAMKGMLDPIFEEKVIGHAEVRQIFKASGVGNIAGSYVLDGVFERGCKVRISREGTQIFEGNLASLKRFKDDVKEVKAGYECGLVFEGFNELQEFDQIEAYKMVEVAR